MDVEKNPIRYALFVSFFPQLVAGPIERSKNLLVQMRGIQEIKLWNAKRIYSGAVYMIWGYFLKMVIADRAALLADQVFDNFRMYGGTEIFVAALFFSIQIYCDFGSYSMIAAGAAKIMGFELMENFNTPYFARDIRDFWNRWHISLSTWFRDYLYVPLGGSRKGKAKKMVNLMVVFLVSGLWHGASWHFIAWGGVHGLYRIIGEGTKNLKQKAIQGLRVNTTCFSYGLLQRMVTFFLVVMAWVFFRANSIADALHCTGSILLHPSPWILSNGELYGLGMNQTEMHVFFFSLIILFLTDAVRYKKGMTMDRFLAEQNLWFRWGAIIAMVVLIFVFGKYGPGFDPQQFIYFQF